MKAIVTIKKSAIKRVAIVLARGRTMAQVQAAEQCDYIINGGLYDMDTCEPVSLLKVDGKVLSTEKWGAWGYAWSTGPDIEMRSIPGDAGGFANYIACMELLTPWDGINAKLSYPPAAAGERGRTAIALTNDSLILYCSSDGSVDAKRPEALRQELYDIGAKTALMLDSGGSSQCMFGGLWTIKSPRPVHNYICVWTTKDPGAGKEENTMSNKPIVCLDPGHGPDTTNGSPDGTYKEQEFAWDMYCRLWPMLVARGIQVVPTRTQATKPSLAERANVSNKAKADLFVSLHSNAYGNGGWSDPHGLLICTSLAGDSAGRNKAARAVLARVKAAGVELHGDGLAHEGYTVLVKTTAPAILIEHGFHTNREDVAKLKDPAYRDKLAKATAQGICDYLGVAWEMLGGPSTPPGGATDPWYAPAQQWAKDKGIADGTRPEEPATRAEVWEMLKRTAEALSGAGKE